MSSNCRFPYVDSFFSLGRTCCVHIFAAETVKKPRQVSDMVYFFPCQVSCDIVGIS